MRSRRALHPGSSPLARGLRAGGRPRPLTRGIIPARAGFTLGERVDSWIQADHPRSRGVYRRRSIGRPGTSGSSPLARGLRGPRPRDPRESGIIPARAGFTMTAETIYRNLTDHPRSRGVYRSFRRIPAYAGGSSPLARGLREPAEPRPAPAGIIPARAGFTRRSAFSLTIPPDHPRSRGVYPSSMRTHSHGRGSSPLARGLLTPSPMVSPVAGIIPARAGFTVRAAGHRRVRPDHPRSRGVY